MILVAFLWFIVWGVGSALICLAVWLLTWLIQDYNAASELAHAWLVTFNGIVVGAAGYGAVFFICRERGFVAQSIERVLHVPDSFKKDFGYHLRCVRSWRITHVVALILTVIGGFIAWKAGIPLQGFSHVCLMIAVISYYYVGALGLMVFVALLRLFRYIENHAGPGSRARISLRSPLKRRDLQSIDLYFVISSAMALLAVYVCFRTTLTAFHNAPTAYYKAMIVPVLFFLPASLIYSFYPRWVLRQVWEADTIVAVDEFAESAKEIGQPDLVRTLEVRKLIMEVKEKMLDERRAAPLFTFKDAPTLTMAFLMLLQLIAQKDPVLADYFSKAFK